LGCRLSTTGIRKRLVVIFILVFTSFLNSLEMDVLPDILITGRVITLKIQTEILDSTEIEVSELVIPKGLELISGPVIRPYYSKIDGVTQRLHQITWALRSTSSGIYILPEIEIKTDIAVFTVEVPTVTVFENDEKFNKYPLIVSWNSNIKREIFVGESLPLIVEAYNLEEINFPDRVISTKPRRGEIIEVSGLGEINPEKVGDADLYRVAVASWIYTPFEAGKVSIPSVRIDINGLTRYTEELELTVKPLPEVNATGGVGEFIITTDISDSQVTPEDFFHYRVKISGQGNIPYIKFPEVEYSGLILIDKKESESIGYSDEGFLGWREIDYTLQALDSGVKEIVLSGVSWIDNDGKDIFFNGNITHINVVSVKVVEEDILPFLSLLRSQDIISSYRFFFYKKPQLWGLLFISLLITLIIKFVKSIRKTRKNKTLLMAVVLSQLLFTSAIFVKGLEYQSELVEADNYIDSGEYTKALAIYDGLTDKMPNNYGLFINKSILNDKLGYISKAVYNIRIAERIAPNNSVIGEIKKYLSKSEESNLKQAKTANPINPDYIFILLIIFFNILVLVIFSLIKNHNITSFSLFFTVLLICLFLGVMLFFVHGKNSVKAGIISEQNASLIKVPNENAMEWLTLDEGNCVYINGEWEDKYLIKTEYGLQGWISKNSILVLEER